LDFKIFGKFVLKRFFIKKNMRKFFIFLTINENGYLATFSCSFYITAEHLIESIKKASKNNFIILESLYQSKDHPWALKFSESLYLKGFLLKRI
jgi:23S rRNA G2069 N7-methylase RlmK/C1962 C5-methylase RlmI